jgi:hypothetical protein
MRPASYGWAVALSTIGLVAGSGYLAGRTQADEREAGHGMAAELLDAPQPVSRSLPPVHGAHLAAEAAADAAAIGAASREQAAQPNLPPNLRLNAAGQPVQAPGCRWANDDPHDLSVNCG